VIAAGLYMGLNDRRSVKLNVFDGPRRMYAVAILAPDSNSGVNGVVKFM
jgi:hypothetical protein